MSPQNRLEHPIEYLPPSQEDIYQLAREIGEQAAQKAELSCGTSELIFGLAEFMKLAGRIQAKHLNRTQVIDKNTESEA